MMAKDDEYPKSSGSAGIKGVEYQLSLSMMFLFNALHNLKGIPWRLSTEHKEAGKFDDVILEGPDGDTLLQAKSRENKKKRITLEDLLSINSKNGDFSLPKYFFSYLEIKGKFRVKNLIICTNAEVHEKADKFLNGHVVPPENLLHFDCDNYLYYTFNENILPQLRENLDKYAEKNSKENRGAITDINLADFLRKLQFFPNYTPTSNFEAHIDRLLSLIKSSNNLIREASFQDVHSKVKEWFEQPKGEYLTEKRANEMFCEIKSAKYCDKLDHHDVYFSNNDFSMTDEQQIYHVTLDSKSRYLLHVLRVYLALKSQRSTVLFIDPDETLDVQKQMIQTFEEPKYTVLVIICPKITEEPEVTEICKRLKHILHHRHYKKIVVLAKSDNVLGQQITLLSNECTDVTSPLTIDSLSRATQDRLLKAMKINFQGSIISTEEVLKPLTNTEYTKYLNYEALESLVNDDIIPVGSNVQELDQHVKTYYVPRKFKRKTKGKEEFYSEGNLYSVNEKMILISDVAGMGKSIILTRLASEIKKTHRHLWVIRLNLTNYTKVLQDTLRRNINDVFIEELLDSTLDTKFRNQFERSLFSIKQKVVLLLDGVDEVSPDYTNLVVNLLVHCQKALNIEKVFATTRPHVSQVLEKELKVKPFMFESFTRDNQLQFLTNYWTVNLAVDERDISKCETYGRLLLHNFSYRSSNHIAGIPLLLRMLAEIFLQRNSGSETAEWAGCKEFLETNKWEPKLPKKMDLSKLYETFIHLKRERFLDKGNPSGNPISNKALGEKFEECLACYEALAVQIILGETVRRYFACCQREQDNLETLLQIGLVQSVNNECQFIHRTFAEYFVAKSLVRELQSKNATIEFRDSFMKFLIEKSSSRHNNVITFFNSSLEDVLESLPSDFFRSYQHQKYTIYRNTFERSISIIHDLVKENMIFILKFLFRCFIGEKIETAKLREKNIYYSAFCNIYFKKSNRGFLVKENLIKILQNLINQGGINIIQDGLSYPPSRATPLFCAISTGNLDMVKFLMQHGANIYLKSPGGFTALMIAAQRGNLGLVEFCLKHDKAVVLSPTTNQSTSDSIDVNAQNKYGCTALHYTSSLDVINFLVEQGADVNIKNTSGDAALHNAVTKNKPNICRLLMEKGADFRLKNNAGRTVLHIAALKGYLSTADLLLEQGADVNIKNNFDNTALHIAASRDFFEICKLLLERGADANAKNKNGDTPLHYAASKGRLKICKLLLERGVDTKTKNRNGKTAVHNAELEGNLEIYKLLLSADPEICNLLTERRDARMEERNLLNTVSTGDLNISKLLVEKGVDDCTKDENGSTALHRAALYGTLDIVNFLLDCGADVNIKNKYGHTALHLAASKNNLKLVELLVDHGADVNIVNASGVTALHRATANGRFGITKFLLDCGGDVNAKNKNGDSPLHYAASKGRLKICKLLLERGVDTKTKNRNSKTALHNAEVGGNLEIYKLLLSADPELCNLLTQRRDDRMEERNLLDTVSRGDVNISKLLVEKGVDGCTTDENGSTALHRAALCGSLDIVNFLLDCGADVNIKNKYGHTALHLAASKNNLKLVEMLVGRGADVNIVNANGVTALHRATANGHLGITKFLLDSGADGSIRNVFGDTALPADNEKGVSDNTLLESGPDVFSNAASASAGISRHWDVLRAWWRKRWM